MPPPLPEPQPLRDVVSDWSRLQHIILSHCEGKFVQWTNVSTLIARSPTFGLDIVIPYEFVIYVFLRKRKTEFPSDRV